MANPSRSNQRRNQQQKPKNIKPVPKHTNEFPQTENEDTPKHKSHCPYTMPETEKSKQKWSTIEHIAFWGVIINVLLAFGTFLLYSEAIHSSKLAMSADSTSNEALGVSKKQFDADNTPYLEIIDATIGFQKDSITRFGCNIRNANGGIAQMMKKIDTIIYVNKADEKAFIDNPYNWAHVNHFMLNTTEYVGKERSNFQIRQPNDLITDRLYNNVKRKETLIYYIRRCIYINPINKNGRREFDCVIQCFPIWNDTNKEHSSYNIIAIDNYDIK